LDCYYFYCSSITLLDAEKYEKQRVGVIVPTYDIEKILHSHELRQLVRMGITYKNRIFLNAENRRVQVHGRFETTQSP